MPTESTTPEKRRCWCVGKRWTVRTRDELLRLEFTRTPERDTERVVRAEALATQTA
jgi:hypothetical protein